MAAYGTTSRDYLARAYALRASSRPEALLYAALEIRCGIEARLQEYLEGAAKVAIVKRDLWKIRHLVREVESAFDVYTKAVPVWFIHPDTGQKMKIEYTPVTPRLRKVGEELGGFLHYTPAHKLVSAGFIERLTKIVDAGIQGLAFATRGTLLGPPSGSGPKNEQIRLMFEEGRMPALLGTRTDGKLILRAILVSKDHERAILKPV